MRMHMYRSITVNDPALFRRRFVGQTAKAFEANLKTSGVPHEVFIYPGQGHAFMNASEEGIKRKVASGHAQHDQASVDLAWKRTAEWFNRYLK